MLIKVEDGVSQDETSSFTPRTGQVFVKAKLPSSTASDIEQSLEVYRNDITVKADHEYSKNVLNCPVQATFQALSVDDKSESDFHVKCEIKTELIVKDEQIISDNDLQDDILCRTLKSQSYEPKKELFSHLPAARVVLQKLSDEDILKLGRTKFYGCVDSRKLVLKEWSYTREKGYVCGFCNLRAKSRSHLKNHIMIHTGEEPYACDLCDYKTRLAASLKIHKRNHTGDMFVCGFCNFETGDSGNLNRHIRTHTGEKPYACDVCDYKTGDGSTLKVHRRLHTGVKPYSCDLCPYKTADRRNFKRHSSTHTGETPYTCGLCKYRTSHLFHLRRHMKRHAKSNL